MIHDKICESRKVNAVDLYAEVLWVRLLTKVDDNGNYYRDVRRVHPACMLEKPGSTEKLSEKALCALVAVELIQEYEADGRRYLHITDFIDHQDLPGDRYCQILHPTHPSEMGGAFFGEGLRRNTWMEKSERVAKEAKDISRSPYGATAEDSRTTPSSNTDQVEVEVKEQVKEQVEDEMVQLTSSDLKIFRTVFRDQTGAKVKIGNKTGETLTELCGRYGLSVVMDALPKWVEDEGGKKTIENDKKKREWAFANFIRDAEEIIEATKAGAFDKQAEVSTFPTHEIPA